MKTHISILSGVNESGSVEEILQKAAYAESVAPRMPLNLDDTTGNVVLSQLRRQVQLIAASNPDLKSVSAKALKLIEKSMLKGKSIHDLGSLSGIGSVPKELGLLLDTLTKLQMMTSPAIQAPVSLSGIPSANSRPINLMSVLAMTDGDYRLFAAKLAVLLRLDQTAGDLRITAPSSGYGNNVGAFVIPDYYKRSTPFGHNVASPDNSFNRNNAQVFGTIDPVGMEMKMNEFVDKIFMRYGSGLPAYRLERVDVIKRLYEACSPNTLGLQLGSWSQAMSPPSYLGEWYLKNGKVEADFLSFMRGPVNQKWFNDKCTDDLGLGGVYTFIDSTTQRTGNGLLNVSSLPNLAQTKCFAQSTFMNNINLFSGVNPAIISTQFRNGIIAKTTKQPEAILKAHLFDNAAALYRARNGGNGAVNGIGLDPVTVSLIIGLVTACLAAVPAIINAANGMATDANGIDQTNVNPPNLPSQSIYNPNDWPNPLPSSTSTNSSTTRPPSGGSPPASQTNTDNSNMLMMLGVAAGAYMLAQK